MMGICNIMYVSLPKLPISQDIDEQLSANHARRTAFLALPKEQREIYDSVGYREKLEAVDEGIRRYVPGLSQFIELEAKGLMVETLNSSMK
jgi:hypothetical protein